MLFNTLFNIVDTIYAGNIGTNALAGMSLSFPVFFVVISLAMGIGTGATALISNSLGEKDKSSFHNLGFNAVALGMLITIFITFFGSWLIAEPLMNLMGGAPDTIQYGLDYINFIFYGSIFFIMNMILNAMLSSQGDTKSYRNVLIIGFALNMILDPLFILGWFGLPKLGTIGVALATVIVQAVGTVYLTYRVIKSPSFELALFKKCRVQLKVWKDLLAQGIPATLNMMTIALGVFVINYFVIRLAGDATIAAYGAAVRIEQLALLPALGLNTAALTITGQNYGARNYDRILEVFKKTMLYSVLIMVLAMIIIYPTAPFLIRIFNQDPEVIEAGTVYLRIEYLCFTTYVIMNIAISVLQGLKRPGIAVYVGLYRQIIMPIAVFYVLSYVLNMGVLGVWWGVVFINWTATIFVIIYVLRKLKIVKNELLQEIT
jgi:putative MATE family efflux protein